MSCFSSGGLSIFSMPCGGLLTLLWYTLICVISCEQGSRPVVARHIYLSKSSQAYITSCVCTWFLWASLLRETFRTEPLTLIPPPPSFDLFILYFSTDSDLNLFTIRYVVFILE